MVDPTALKEFWVKNWDGRMLQIPEEDRSILERFHHFDDATYNEVAIEKNWISTALPPYPYSGDLREALVYVVMMNPGIGRYNFDTELNVNSDIHARSLEARRRSVFQDLNEREYPFVGLDPSFENIPGFDYWHTFFDDILRQVSPNKLVAQKVVVLETCAYHSKGWDGFNNFNILRLESTKRMLEFIKSEVIPSGRLVIFKYKICWNIAQAFGIEDGNNIMLNEQRRGLGNDIRQRIIDVLRI